MSTATKYAKLYVMALCLGGVLGALGYRLVDLQIARHDELETLAQQNTVRTIERQPMRGQIMDIRGTPLALSQPAKVVCADPTLIGPMRPSIARPACGSPVDYLCIIEVSYPSQALTGMIPCRYCE